MTRNRVLHWKHLPSKPLSPLWWWLYLEVCKRVFDIPSTWTAVLYTLLVLFGIANTISFFAQVESTPSWDVTP